MRGSVLSRLVRSSNHINQKNQTDEMNQRDQMHQFPATRREMLDCKTSYLDSVGQRICSHDVELAEPQDTGKTLGE